MSVHDLGFMPALKKTASCQQGLAGGDDLAGGVPVLDGLAHTRACRAAKGEAIERGKG